MNNLSHYVRVYDNAFSPAFCNFLIEEYEKKKDKFKTYRLSEHEWEFDYRSFEEVNICEEEIFKPYLTQYYDRIKDVYNQYVKDVNSIYLPKDAALEAARLKKYENNDVDQFGWHTDVNDAISSKRFLVMFAYLNDVAEGGETEFESKSEEGFTVTPKCGRIVVFPPMWMFPHKGKKPISNPKYILSTYLHYK